jgi:DNA-binding MarR family transcriptional regulator
VSVPGPTLHDRFANPGAEAWELIWELFRASLPYIESVAAEFDLSKQQMYALKHLSSERPVTMSELASALGCDASNVTSIVDKLEGRGFVMRKSADYDRRVKALLVTPAGAAVQERISARSQKAPPAIEGLSAADQRSLRDLLRRALDSLP